MAPGTSGEVSGPEAEEGDVAVGGTMMMIQTTLVAVAGEAAAAAADGGATPVAAALLNESHRSLAFARRTS